MKANDIMTRDVITVTPETSVTEAIALLTRHAIASLPVLDEDGEVVGIVSEPDLLKDRIPHDQTTSMIRHGDGPDPGRTVEDVMNEPVVCLPPTADAADVAQILLTNHVRAVPIIDGPDLVGIVSRRDLLRIVQRDSAKIAADVRVQLTAYSTGSTGRRNWQVDVEEGIVTITGTFLDSHEQTGVSVLAHSVPGVVRVHTNPA